MDIVGRTLLGKYRVERLLGQGGMGSVWLGTHVGTGRKVAVKVLDERFLSSVPVVQRFGREARAASAVQHEGIVEVLDLDQTEDGLPFLVMEYLEGESLASRIERKGKLSEDEIVHVARLLLDALHAAHERGVVHRDLKPDNIYLVPAGRRGEIVKILDFGISSKDDEQTSKLTQTGSVLGTPHYMSPEQAMGDVSVDRRVDIYATGVLLYECAVGAVPFDAPNYNKLLRVILDEPPVPPIERGALIGRELEAAILAALSKERADRPPTALALAQRIEAAKRSRPSGAPPARRSTPPGGGAGWVSPAAPPTASPASTGDAASSWASASLDVAAPAPKASSRSLPKQPPPAVAGFDDFAPAGGQSALAFDEEALAGARRTGSRARPADLAESGEKEAVAARVSAPPAAPAPAPASVSSGTTGARRAIAAEPPSAPPPAPAAPAERPWWVPYAIRAGVALGIFLGLVIGLRWLVDPGETEAIPPPVPVAEPDAGPSVASPDWVQVEITGLPPAAEVRLDGLPGVTMPMRLRRGTHHRVVVRAPGYADRTLEIDATESTSIHADLDPL